MSVISQIKWKLASTEKKLATLKKRGLTIGEGCEILNGYDFGSEPYLVTIGENVRITAGVKITITMAVAGCFAICIRSLVIAIALGA